MIKSTIFFPLISFRRGGGCKALVGQAEKDEIATIFYARKQLTQKRHEQIICKTKP
jgi:hypothetical protein